MEQVTAGGIRIAYDAYGDPGSETVFLIPGLGMQRWMWPESFISTLLASGFRVISVDNRDSGGSSRIPGEVSAVEELSAVGRAILRLPVKGVYGLEAMARDVLGVADALGTEHFFAAGISMGGMIAQSLACMAPDRVRGLASISSATGNPRTGLGKMSTVWTVVSPEPEPKTDEELYKRAEKLLAAIGSPVYPRSPEEIRGIVSHLKENTQDPMGFRRQLMAILQSGDRSRQVVSVRVPAVVIHGDADPLLPLAAGRETARLIPGAELHVIEGMGHDLPEVLGARVGGLVAERFVPLCG